MSAATVLDLPSSSAQSFAAKAEHAAAAPAYQGPVVCCLAWSLEGTLLAAGTADGFILYSCEQAVTIPLRAPHGHGGAVGSGGVGVSGGQPSYEHSGDTSSLLMERQREAVARSLGWEELCRRPVASGVGRVALCGSTGLVLFTGASPDTRHVVTLWADRLYRPGGPLAAKAPHILATMTMDVPVRSLHISRHHFIIADTAAVHIFDGALQPVRALHTVSKKATLDDHNANTVAVAHEDRSTLTGVYECLFTHLVTLGPSVGTVCVVKLMVGEPKQQHRGAASGAAELESFLRENRARVSTPLRVHDRAVRTIGISANGSIAVTVSDNGTALKVIDVDEGVVLRQLSRGTTPNVVPTIALSRDGSHCIALSESGTLHCFWLLDQPPIAYDARGNHQGHHHGGPHRAGPHGTAHGGALAGVPGWAAPDSLIFGNRFVRSAVNYVNSHKAVATCSLLDPIADSEVLTSFDISHSAAAGTPLSAAMSCVALQPISGHSSCTATAMVCVGGLEVGTKARCLQVTIDLSRGAAERVATFVFPRDQM